MSAASWAGELVLDGSAGHVDGSRRWSCLNTSPLAAHLLPETSDLLTTQIPQHRAENSICPAADSCIPARRFSFFCKILDPKAFR